MKDKIELYQKKGLTKEEIERKTILPLICQSPDGSFRKVPTICNTRDHIDNWVAEGFIKDEDRYDYLIKLIDGNPSDLISKYPKPTLSLFSRIKIWLGYIG